ncbi:MAG TPA: hypothetical protein P5525_11135 [Candidatus Paceibacterota bacterium]|nr:hypothetical protein [Candidatus Paceibacterota bacterium]
MYDLAINVLSERAEIARRQRAERLATKNQIEAELAGDIQAQCVAAIDVLRAEMCVLPRTDPRRDA